MLPVVMKLPSFGWMLVASTLVVLLAAHLPALSFAALTVPDGLRTLLSALLTGSILSLALTFSRWSGVRAAAGVFLLFWGVSHFNTLNEAVFFGVDFGSTSFGQLALASTAAAVVVAIGLTFITGRWKEGAAPSVAEEMSVRSPVGWAWRLLLTAFAYVVFYFVAGIIIFPFVQEFYAGRELPGLGTIFVVQIFRGLVYAGIGVMVIRMAVLSRRATALFIGAALSILGGIAPLLLPNEMMPERVRMFHMAEVGVSNFLFGVVLSRMLDPRVRRKSVKG